jgi:hypothetical protein
VQAALFSRLIWARDQGQRPVSSARYSSTVASETSTDSLATQRGFTAFELLHDEVRLSQPPASRSATTVPGMAGRVHPPRTWYQPSASSSCLDFPGRPEALGVLPAQAGRVLRLDRGGGPFMLRRASYRPSRSPAPCPGSARP